MVQSMTDEFQPYELKLPTVNNRVLLESVEKHLEMHHPPLMLLTVHNLPATARPADRTLAVEFSQGQRLDTVAQILPGWRRFDAYPSPLFCFVKGLQSFWINT